MQVEQDRLKSENTNLIMAFREKSRKAQQTQELYDRLKRKEMTAATQSAAYETVDEVLGSVPRHDRDFAGNLAHFPNIGRPQGQQDFTQFTQMAGANDGLDHGFGRQRDENDGGHRKDGIMMPPPPPRRQAGYGNSGIVSCLCYSTIQFWLC